MGNPERVTAYDDLPAVTITASQLVAWNMARFRQAAGLRQEELAARIGSTRKSVSALETSWKGGRPRQFDAGEIIALAAALGVPVAAFLLPPDDDGVTCRYALAMPGGRDDLSMAALATYIIAAPSEDDTDAMAYYRSRHAVALAAYLDPAVAHEIAGTFDALTTGEQVEDRQRRLSYYYDALRAVLLDIDGQQDALERRREELRGT